MSDTLLQRLAAFIAALHRTPPPGAILDDAARRVRDVIGNSLAAADSEPARVALELIGEASGRGEATPIGAVTQVPASSAAFVNGTLAHALDFDDTHLPSILHPSASVVPASLAIAERLARDGTELCTAVAIGDEVCIRLGMAGYDEQIADSVFFERGLHATSICGTIGATAAAAYLMRLGPTEVGHALGIAVSMGAGILEANRTGGSVKQIHCGWAAQAGITAADLARLGITGPPTAFEGRFGFLQAYLGDRSHPDLLVERLGQEWKSLETFFKPYPANHFTHAVIDCARALRETVRADQIQRVEIGVAAPVLRTIAEPEDQKKHPVSGYAAKFSGPYTFAAAFLGGGGLGVGLEDFTDEAAADPARLELAGRVRFHADEECSTIYPRQFPAVARAVLADGESRQARVLVNRGGPQNPLSDEELGAKFRSNAATRLSAERIDRLDAELAHLVQVESISRLVSLCTMDGA